MFALVGYLLSKPLKQALNVASSLREDPVWLTTALWDVAGRKELPPSVVLNKQSMTPSTSEMQLYVISNVDVCFLALFGHGAMSDLSPLSGAKRKTSALSEYFAF
jgi:hypothetical protein